MFESVKLLEISSSMCSASFLTYVALRVLEYEYPPLLVSCSLPYLQVTHGVESFEAGDSVILTLKDQALLEEDEHGQATGLADGEDELENVTMKEAEVCEVLLRTV